MYPLCIYAHAPFNIHASSDSIDENAVDEAHACLRQYFVLYRSELLSEADSFPLLLV